MVNLSNSSPAVSSAAPVRASYNITDDRLKAWFSDRLSNDDYKAMRAAGFVFWRGSRCFTCVWRPQAEDILTASGFTIEADDTPDDTEARVERFAARADEAEAAAKAAERYLDSGRANTERRRNSALAQAERETEKAEHYLRRVLASIRRAQYRESPGVIARRIEKLETSLRRHEYDAAPPSSDPRKRNVCSDGSVSFWVDHGGRHGFWQPQDKFAEAQAWANRWIAHIEDRLTYERALLAAAGGLQADIAAPGGEKVFEVGGAAKCRAGRGEWVEITRVNRKTIEVYDPFSSFMKFWKIPFTEVSEVATAAQVESGEVSLLQRAPKPEKKAAAPKVARDGTTLEVFGAIAFNSYFTNKPAEYTWLLAAKVNRSTVEGVYLREGKLYGRKFSFREIMTAKSPEEAKTMLPEVVERWTAHLEKVKAKKAAAKQAKAEAAVQGELSSVAA